MKFSAKGPPKQCTRLCSLILLPALFDILAYYRAFDEYEGIEVAWNQVKLYDFLQSPEDLERLYCEIHLLKTLKHPNIMKFYTSWVDTANRNINFVTEMFTSGTLRQYRLKHRKVNIRAVKHWCRQILKGLLYLHSHNPPVIHRDLKCDNIFINGNQGQVKIGDLGLAAILRKSHAVRCVGTPEFMAPEVYKEEYNELVDIYSFGMCMLEMVTFEYPYSECNHPAQIYRRVVSGRKPEALYKVKDPEVRQFVEKCLATASLRLPAKELLKDPFLQVDDIGSDLYPSEEFGEVGPLLRLPYHGNHHNYEALMNGCSHNYLDDGQPEHEFEGGEIDLFTYQEDEDSVGVGITVKGRREDDGIFLRLRIADGEGRIRNIYFPFDIESDTPLSVATEMVAELDITDQDVNKIAEMIDGEIATLVPEWKAGPVVEDDWHPDSGNLHYTCASTGSTSDYVSASNSKNLQVLEASHHGCAEVHGRFEEITYQDGRVPSSRTDGAHHTDVRAQHESSSSRIIYCDDTHKMIEKLSLENDDEKIITVDDQSESSYSVRKSSYSIDPQSPMLEDYENEIRRELRWLKAKYQMQLREIRDQQLGDPSRSSRPARLNRAANNNGRILKSLSQDKPMSLNFNPKGRCANAMASESFSPDCMTTAKSFFTGALLPQPLNRATSLPVDAVDF
ncbi:hypothetical protein CDL15_Pgr008573 [Punica granatum]|uniref:non-specific serine/threonine protein kinase n=1 Tax=Punica granatum TaxID=22663 RepID=A0A218WP56_PUNGR|nr:hypothetical protein CDL15_Pgr008573 [Punica granatum]